MSGLGAFDASDLGAYIESGLKARGAPDAFDTGFLRTSLISGKNCAFGNWYRSFDLYFSGSHSAEFGASDAQADFYAGGVLVTSFAPFSFGEATAAGSAVGSCPGWASQAFTNGNMTTSSTPGLDLGVIDEVRLIKISTGEVKYRFSLTLCDETINQACFPYTTDDYFRRFYV